MKWLFHFDEQCAGHSAHQSRKPGNVVRGPDSGEFCQKYAVCRRHQYGRSHLVLPDSVFVSVAHLVVRYISLHWRYGKIFFIVVVVAAFAGAVAVDLAELTLPMGISSCFSAYCVFLMGMALKQSGIMGKLERWDLLIVAVTFVLLVVLTPYGPIGIGVGSIVNLPLFCAASLAGRFMTYCAARRIRGWLAAAVAYCGTHSVWTVTLHFLAFKIMAAIYLLTTDADMRLLSSFPIYYAPGLWIAYTIVGIGVPLLLSCLWKGAVSGGKRLLNYKRNDG